MIAPNTAFDGAAALKACPTKRRCTPDCPNRTVTCKFDGSCDGYKTWRADYDKTLNDVKTTYSGDRDIAKMIAIKHGKKQYQATVAFNKRYGNGG